jgi:hypothetical protein
MPPRLQPRREARVLRMGATMKNTTREEAQAVVTIALLTSAFALLACRSKTKETTVEYEPSDAYVFSREERRAIEDVAERTIPEVRRLLPDLPSKIVIEVRTSTAVIPETGETATTRQPNVVAWQVDASRKEGVAAIARAQLRPTLFHELSHLVRGAIIDDRRLKDDVIREGLGTAFERDFGGASPPWGRYPADVSLWAHEVLSLPDDAPPAIWLYRHPDGRRWIGLRVGTYLVDCAMKSSGKSSAQLVRVPTDALLSMCPDG